MEMAQERLYAPLWSDYVFEEWRLLVARRHPEEIVQQDQRIERLKVAFPDALIIAAYDLGVVLPDAADEPILNAAVAGGATILLTENRKDFPSRIVERFGLAPRAPDEFLMSQARATPDKMHQIGVGLFRAHMQIPSSIDLEPTALRRFFKKAHLPRFAKWLERSGQTAL